jgi:hypothetical protein
VLTQNVQKFQFTPASTAACSWAWAPRSTTWTSRRAPSARR